MECLRISMADRQSRHAHGDALDRFGNLDGGGSG